jgi:folate-binding protein YgfZ
VSEQSSEAQPPGARDPAHAPYTTLVLSELRRGARERKLRKMASNEIQTTWLTEGVGVFLTTDRVVRLQGEDSQSWLNGQVTNDVRELEPRRAVYALTVSLKGRIHSDLWALRTPADSEAEPASSVALVLPQASLEPTLAAFEKHIIMEDVELAPDSDLRVITLQGPRAEALLEALGLSARAYACSRLGSVPGFDVWLPEAEVDAVLNRAAQHAPGLGGGVLDAAGWAHAHVVLGVPRAGVDFGPESYPQEAGLKARAVSFSKGCYTGQEVVYMLEKRGQAARRLVQLSAPGAAPAAPASVISDAEGQRVGEVTSATQSGSLGVALGYVKRAHAHVGAGLRIDAQIWEVRCVLGESQTDCPIIAAP